MFVPLQIFTQFFLTVDIISWNLAVPNSAAKSCNKRRGCRRESSKTVTLLLKYFLLNQSFYLFKAAQYSGLLSPEVLWIYLLGSQIAHSCKHSCQSVLDHHLPLKSPREGLYRAQKQFYDSIPFSNSSKFTLELCWFSFSAAEEQHRVQTLYWKNEST